MGTLTDFQIIARCKSKELIEEEFDEKNVKQACYELRASNIYYDIYKESRKITISNDEYILIKPKQCIVIITKEKLNMPDDMIGRILTKGKLFSIGISAVNTYADPGFCGRLGIVLINLSNFYIKIHEGDSIAKIEFSSINDKVKRPYKGQHGYDAEIWPIPVDMILTKGEIKSDARISDDFTEISDAFGDTLADYVAVVFKYQRRLFVGVCAIMTFLLLSLIIAYHLSVAKATFEMMLSIVIGLIASMFGSAFFWHFTRKK